MSSPAPNLGGKNNPKINHTSERNKEFEAGVLSGG